jgi:protein translocase SecG subunit
VNDVLRYLLFGLHTIVSIALIILVVSQSNKAEGLGAVGGSSSASSFRGRAGYEEQMNTYTKYTAFAFMILSVLLYLFALKFSWR